MIARQTARFTRLFLVVCLAIALVNAQIEVQHCKRTTVTKTVSRTRLQTVVKTVTLRSTPTLRATPSPAGSQIKTVTKTVSASSSPITVRFHPTASYSFTDPIHRLTNMQERLVGMSMFVGDNPGCDPLTGRPLNASAIGWNVLVSRGDLKAGSCNNLYWTVQPGSQLVQATLSIECKGKTAFLQIHSYGKWVAKCDKSTLVNGIVFPNGYNCTSRAAGYNPPYEVQLTTDVCSNRALPGPSAQAAGTKSLQFASVFNLYSTYGRGIGGNFTNMDMATNSSEMLKNGVQVMVLAATGALDTKATTPVTLSLVEQPGSPGIAWGRVPRIVGTRTVVPVMGVASFGELGIPTAGNFRLRACIDGNICTNSPIIDVLVEDVVQAIILNQPPKNTELQLWNPKTAEADFTPATGPLNVTFTDSFDNYGAQSNAFGQSGLVDANITCQVATAIAPDAVGFNADTAKLVNTVSAIWTPSGFAEIWSLGAVREGLDAAFGPGTVAGALEGFRCWADVNLGPDFRVDSETQSATSNYWLLK